MFTDIHPSHTLCPAIPWAQTFPQDASSLSGKLQGSDKLCRNNAGVIINLPGTYAQTFIAVPLHEAE